MPRRSMRCRSWPTRCKPPDATTKTSSRTVENADHTHGVVGSSIYSSVEDNAVTEVEWLACEDPKPLLVALGTVTVRKQRLLGLACCRRFRDQLCHPDLQRALTVAEAWSEGACEPSQRKRARRGAHEAGALASAGSLEDGLSLSDSAAWAVQRLLQRGA